MDPIKQITAPVAEVRQAASHIDEYGETWTVIDGIETKVPSIKLAKKLLAQQDAVRVQIRADLDAAGIRFNPDGTDREEQVKITLDDGTVTTVGLMKPGDANYMQIGKFPDAAGLSAEIDKAPFVFESHANLDTKNLYARPGRFEKIPSPIPAHLRVFHEIGDGILKLLGYKKGSR